MKKVNLFVVGAMKAGTTAFTEMLAQHPDIYFSPVKEPHYFVKDLPQSMYSPSRFFSLEKYLDEKFPEPLHITHIQTLDQYEKIFSKAPDNVKYRAEGSTGYLHAPESAKIIYDYNPNAKIIILTRDPLKRAYSHYQMNAGLGRETRSFEEAISQDIKDYQAGKRDQWNYLGMSIYQENIQRFLNIFGENVLVIDLRENKENPTIFLDKINRFLQIQTYDFNLERKNESRNIKNPKLQNFLFQSGVRDIARQILPNSLRQKLFEKLSTSKQTLEISEKTQNEFNKIIQSYPKESSD
ncbi:MAG: sulfotransferase [Flavobacteriaceae bacterium]|nr:sulfotransferase [Flavobacteriaceae bacterium]